MNIDFTALHSTRVAIIMSAECGWRTPRANATATANLRRYASSVLAAGGLDAVLCCDGCYKGAAERSIMIVGGFGALTRAKAWADEFRQESVLVVNHYGMGRLVFADGSGQEDVVLGRARWLEPLPGQERPEAYTVFDGFPSSMLVFD